MFVDVADDFLHPEGFLSILRKDPLAVGKGRHIANLAGAPNFQESDTRENVFEGVYGQTGDVKGQEQIQMVRAEISVSIISLTLDNLKLLRPDLQFSPVFGADGLFASLVVGAANAAYRLTAKARGTSGNSTRFNSVTPAGAGANPGGPVVSVVGNDITLTHTTGATAGVSTSTALQIVNAINANPQAAALVTAALNAGSDGSGLGAVQAIVSLSGGTAGSVVGVRLIRSGVLQLSHYRKNVCLVWSTTDQNAGGCMILREALNVEEDREYDFDDDGTVFGVDATFRCHTDGSTIDMQTGLQRPNFEEHHYGQTMADITA